MPDTPTHDHDTQQLLEAAYAHITNGELATAQHLLRPLVKRQPRNADAWWLLANTFDDPKRRAQALQHVLTLDADHAAAKKALQRLAQHPAPPAPPVNKRSLWVGLALVGVLVLVALVGAAVLILSEPVGPNREARLEEMTRSAADLTATASARLNAAANATVIAQPGTPTPPSTARATLPPQIIPTATVPATIITNTPRPTLQLPPSPTPGIAFAPSGGGALGGDAPVSAGGGAAAPVGDDYWFGYDRAMTQAQVNGRYYRFYDFPVQVWVGRPPNPSWAGYIDDAIRQVGEVVPLTRTTNEGQADLILDFAPGQQVTALCGGTGVAPQQSITIGCGGLTYDRDKFALTDAVDYIGFAYIANEQSTDEQARLVILHELLHAVGIAVHSQYPEDVMYFRYGEFGAEQSATMTTRDYNTLRRLYASPAFGAE